MAPNTRFLTVPEPLGDDALEVDPPPAHDPVLLPIRARFHDPSERRHLLFRQARLAAFSPVVQEPVRPGGVETVNPVAKGLAIHAANLRRRTAIHAVPHPGQRQEPTTLIDVPRPSSKRPQFLRRIILSQSHGC
jgi:hypothetical protein